MHGRFATGLAAIAWISLVACAPAFDPLGQLCAASSGVVSYGLTATTPAESHEALVYRLPPTSVGGLDLSAPVDDAPAAAVDARMARLEAAVADLEKEGAQEPAEEPAWSDVARQGWTARLGGRAQADYWMWPGQNAESRAAYGPLQNYFEYRRLHFDAEGTGYGVYDFKLQVDFEPEPGLVVPRDVYAGIHDVPLLGYVRFGHIKEPFSLERLTAANYLSFLERSVANALAPLYHVGATAAHCTADESIGWSSGVFLEDIDPLTKQCVDDNQGIDLAQRVWASPIYTAEGRGVLHLGGAYIFTDDRDDQIELFTRPETHEETIFLGTGPLAADTYQRVNVELAAVYGPLSLQGELFGLRTRGTGGAADCSFYGAYAYASYFLTGEHRPYSRGNGVFQRVDPLTSFWVVPTADGPCAGCGAWELLARWSYLDLDDAGMPGDAAVPLGARFRGQINDLTLAVNWYWNPNVRWMVNYVHAWTDLSAYGMAETDALGTGFHFFF